MLLSRVYADQGKDRKALEELEAALQAHPTHSLLNRTAAQLYMKLGQRDLGVAALKKAADAAPSDPEILDLLRRFGVAYTPAPPAPPPAPPPVAAPPAAAPRAAPPRVQAGPAAVPPMVARATDAAPQRAAPPAARPAPVDQDDDGDLDISIDDQAGRPKGPRNTAYSEELADRYATQEFTLSNSLSRRKQRHRGTFKTTVGLMVVLGIALAGYAAWTAKQKQRALEIEKLIKQTRELLEKDTYKGYREAAANCEKMLEQDQDSIAGHAYLAYIDAIRSGEHGDGERVRDEAKQHLATAQKLTNKHSHIFAADAYLKYYAGDVQGAIDELHDVIAKESDSGFLSGALGVILMQSGDLDGAKVALDKARRLADRDARVNQMLAELFRRRGAGFESQAENSYGTVLRYTPDHAASMLGYAMMLLSAQRFDEAMKGAAKVLELGEGASPRQVALAEAVKASVLFSKGKTADGTAEEQKALGLDSSNPDIYAVIGERKLRDNDVAGAVEAYQKAISLDPRRQMFYAQLSQALGQKEGGAKLAIDALNAAAAKLPGDARIARLQGDAYRAVKQYDDSQRAYEKAISLAKPRAQGEQKVDDRGFPEAHLGLGRLFREKGDAAGAQRELEEARKQYQRVSGTGVAEAEVELAEVELGRDATGATAMPHFKAALVADPKSCPALWGYGRLSLDRKQAEDARKNFTGYAQLCARGPHAADATRLLGSIR
jgi:tetratricopeptide (TPR) repeat protein